MLFTFPAFTTASAPSPYTAPVRRPVEPVGRYFLAHSQRAIRGHTWLEHERHEAETNVKTVEEKDEELEDEEQDDELLSIDPREWKTADLYAVLGLLKYRYRATAEQIVRAHRRQVLKHHPDKKLAAGGTLEQDGFFKIVQKAFETMTDATKRAQYDSVDKGADVLPPKNEAKDFYAEWAPVFASELRFAKKTPVPELGDALATKQEVDAFYSYWLSFDLWRTFEFLDDEVPDDTANRDHKRYIERKNVALRKKHKQEDNRRLIALVQRAQAEDPRIKQFKDAAKQKKAAAKWEKERGAREEAERLEKERIEKEEREAREKAEAALSKELLKKAKEAAKSAKKKNKRNIRAGAKDAGLVAEEVDIVIDNMSDEQLVSVAAGDVAAGVKQVAAELVAAKKVAASTVQSLL